MVKSCESNTLAIAVKPVVGQPSARARQIKSYRGVSQILCALCVLGGERVLPTTNSQRQILKAAGPVSRILSAGLTRQDGHSSRPRVAARLKRPTRRFGAPSRHAPGRSRASSLFGLAPCGVCHARTITGAAVRSYRTFSPLPGVAVRRYVFCGTCRKPALKPASRTLSGTLLCGVRTFLFRHSVTKATVRSSCLQFTLYSISSLNRRDHFPGVDGHSQPVAILRADILRPKHRRQTCRTSQM